MLNEGDLSTSTWYGDRIRAEPYFAIAINDPANTWNKWSTDGTENRLRFFESTEGATGANYGSYNDPDWQEFITLNALSNQPYDSREVLYFSLQTASAWANGFTGRLDGLRIELKDGSVATVNFEATLTDVTSPTVPTSGYPHNLALNTNDFFFHLGHFYR